MKALIAPISHSPLCSLTFSHNDPQDQPCVQIIQNNPHAHTCVQWNFLASEQSFCITSLRHSQGKR